MPKLTIVIVNGALGAGKTRLIAELAARSADPEAVAAVVHAVGPVSLDGLWLPGLRVVSLEAGCGCAAGDSPLADALILLHEELGVDLALVELAAEQDVETTLRGLAELVEPEDGGAPEDVAELIVVTAGSAEAAAVGEGDPLTRLREAGCVVGELPELEHGHEHGAGCGCGHHGHAGGGCHCNDRRAAPQWFPFWFAGGVEEEALCETIDGLPAEVTRAKAVMELSADEWLLVDRTGREVTRRRIARDELPALYDLESLAQGEPLDPVPPDGGTLLVCWCHAADEPSSVALEWALDDVLTACFGEETDPAEAERYARETLDDPDRILEVITAARAAAAATPESADRLELLAKAYHALAENERALVLLREAARHEPTHQSSRLNAARIHLAYDEPEEAQALAAAVLADHPGEAEARAVLGEALAVAGDLEQGLPHLEAAAAAMPDDDLIRAMLSNLLAELGELERALAYSDEVVALDPEDGGSQYFRGLLLLRLGRLEEAREALEEALLVGNETPWVMTALGIVAHLQGRAADAADLFDEAATMAEAELEDDPSGSAVVDLLLAHAFGGSLEAAHDLLAELDTVATDELESARELLVLAPGCGHAAGLLVAIDGIIVANES